MLRQLQLLSDLKLLVNHKFIHPEEVHIKIGGDHGDDSFKMGYQIANVLNRNRPDNTITFSYFCAKNSRSNLKSCLSRFTRQIDRLQTLKFQEKRIRVFMYGDYEFLCIMYGLTGANGKFSGLNSVSFFFTTKM